MYSNLTQHDLDNLRHTADKAGMAGFSESSQRLHALIDAAEEIEDLKEKTEELESVKADLEETTTFKNSLYDVVEKASDDIKGVIDVLGKGEARDSLEKVLKALSGALVLFAVLFSGTGCAGVKVNALARCGSIENNAKADCGDVIANVRTAVEMYGAGGAEVIARASVQISDCRFLYRNAVGSKVAGTTRCVNGRPVIVLDRTMGGLLHEMFHAADCLAGKPMEHDARHSSAERYFSRILPPRRLWTAEEVAEERAARSAEAMFLGGAR